MAVKFGAMARRFGIREQSGVLYLGDDVSKLVWTEAHQMWRSANKKGWLEQAWGEKSRTLEQDMEAMREIVWRLAWNE